MEPMSLATIAINMATLGATALRCPSKTRLPSRQRKGSITREHPREAVKVKAANGAAMAARPGTTGRVSEISGAKVGSSVGTNPMERASGRRA